MTLIWSALWLVLRVAGVGTAAALVLGVCAGRLLGRRGGMMLSAALALPPMIATAYFLGPRFDLTAATIAAVLAALPWLARESRLAFLRLDPRYEDAARSLGASEWRVFWRIALPLAARPVLAAAAIAFVRVATEFVLVMVVRHTVQL
jgi:molybdate transport system permease protein